MATTEKKDTFFNSGPFSGVGNFFRSGPFSPKARAQGINRSGMLNPKNKGKEFDAFKPEKGGIGLGTTGLAIASPIGALITARGGLQGRPAPQVNISSPSREAAQSDALRRAFQIAGQQQQEIPQEEAPPPIYGKTLGDFLAQAQSVTGGGIANQLAALAAQREAAQQSAARGDQQLAQMYQALQNVTQQDNTAAQARYAQAQQESAALTAAGQQALLGANTAVDNAQNDTLANLGISGANDRPGGAAGVQEEAARIANSQNQAIGNTAGQALIAGGLAQGNLGAAMGTAAQFAGASRRSDLQNALMKMLQEIGGQEASLRDSQSQVSSSLAAQLYNDDYSRWRDQRDFETGRDDEAWRRAYQESQLGDGTPSAADLQGPDKAIYQLQAGGVSPQDQRAIMALIAAGANNSGTDAKGMKTSTFQGAYRAIQEAVASGQLSPQLQGVAIQAAVEALGGY